VPTPGIGVVVANEAAAARLGVEGVVVGTVAGSPAERAGFRGIDQHNGTVGDIIVGANGKHVRTLADLTDEVDQVGIGHDIKLTVKRGGSTVSLDPKVADMST